MIKLFKANEKTFTTNGDAVIKALKARIHKEDNGAFYLDLEAGSEYAPLLKHGAILVAPTPEGEQAFRISNPTATKKKISFRANHVYYDGGNFLIKDSYVVNKNCAVAMQQLNAATDTPSPFTTVSNIGTVDSFRCVRKSLNEAVQVILERWGGHLVRDNWQIGVLAAIGQDKGVTIRYAKNLQEISRADNWDSVVTKLLPTGTDGIMLDALDNTVDPYLYAIGVDYGIPYTKTVSFNQNVNKTEFGNDERAYKQALIDDLRAQALAYLDENCVPKVNYTLKANLDRITAIGDTVEVIDNDLGVNLLTNVIAYDYDCLRRRYVSLEFGNFKNKLSNLIETITQDVTTSVSLNINQSAADFEAQINQIQAQINATLGGGYVVYDGDKILVVDRLPKETARNVIRINQNGISFSQSGIGGAFTSAWSIDGTLNMQAVNVINFTADLIRGGTLRLGENTNAGGVLEVTDAANNIIGRMDSNGLKMFAADGSYVLMNNTVGFAGYDRLGNKAFWADSDEFHMKKSVIEEEITFASTIRLVPITLYNNGVITSQGVGIVPI